MRLMIKRRCIYGVLCLLTLVCTLFFFGCGGLDDSQSKPKDYGYEKTGNDVGLCYDADNYYFLWKHDNTAARYELMVEDQNGNTYLVGLGSVDNFAQDDAGRLKLYAKSNFQNVGKNLTKDVNLLLIAYGDSYEKPLWHLRVPYEFYKTPELRISRETGEIVWDAVEGAKEYLVTASGEEYITTSPSFNVLSVMGENIRSIMVEVRALGEKNGAWISSPCDGYTVYTVSSPIVDFRGKILSFYGVNTKLPDGKVLDAYDYVYQLDIYDGNEHICLEDITLASERSSTYYYPYVPETDNFYFSVKATVKKEQGHDNILPSRPTVYKPTYQGSVDQVTFNPETATLEWNKLGSGAYVTVDGEERYLSDASYSIQDLLRERYEGEFKIEILPDMNGDGYATASTHTVIFPSYVDIAVLESSTYENMDVEIAGFDQWATGCIVEKYDDGVLAETRTFELTEGTVSTDFAITTREERFNHMIYVRATYPENLLVIPRTSSYFVYLQGVPIVRDVRQDRVPIVQFQTSSKFFEVEFNGEVTVCDDEYSLPAEIYEATEEKEFTIRVRTTYNGREDSCSLPSLWKEYTIRTLDVPSNLRTEGGVLYWDYDGERDIKSYAVSHTKVFNQYWKMSFYSAGKNTVSVWALADNSDAVNTGIWYINGQPSETVTVEKLTAISNLTHNDYGMTWDAVDNATDYEVSVKSYKEGLNEKIVTADPEFVASEYLKKAERLLVEVRARGDGVTTVDGGYTSFYVTRNPGFTYSMDNTTNWDGYYSQVFWEYAVPNAKFDYQLISPSGEVIDSAKGISVGQTNAIRDATDRNPAGVLERGEYTLRVVTAAAQLSYDTYYLKTGDEALDGWNKSIYKTWVDISIKDGVMTLEYFPKLTDKGYAVSYFSTYSSDLSSTGIFTLSREQIDKAFADLEERSYTWGISLQARAEAYERVFAFESRGPEAYLTTEVKKAPTPIPTYSEYTPGSVYYDVTGVGNIWNATLDAERTVYSTVKVDAGVDIEAGMQYVFTSLLEDGTVWKTVKTTERTCVMDIPEFGSVHVAVEANILSDDGATYYQSSEAVVLAFECSNIGLGPFVIKEGNLVVGFSTGKASSLELWLNGEYVATLQFSYNQEYYYMYTFDTPLQSGDVVELRGWWTKDGWERSADYYFYKTVP